MAACIQIGCTHCFVALMLFVPNTDNKGASSPIKQVRTLSWIRGQWKSKTYIVDYNIKQLLLVVTLCKQNRQPPTRPIMIGLVTKKLVIMFGSYVHYCLFTYSFYCPLVPDKLADHLISSCNDTRVLNDLLGPTDLK
jgi:hypothetical protein